MAPTEPTSDFYNFIKYNPIRIERYVYSLPIWRRIFARFSEKYKVTKQEYDNWFRKDFQL